MSLLQRLVAIVIFFQLVGVEINPVDGALSSYCRTQATLSTTEESNQKDTVFFKKCIVEYYGFIVKYRQITVIPKIDANHFLDHRKHQYMRYIAKRVERFFIRNGNWYNLLGKKDLFKPKNQDCRKLLYIVAAKYVYALYVLNTVAGHSTCMPCRERSRGVKHSTYSLTSRGSVCYIKPKYLNCAEQIELNLLGHKSGSLTVLFNQFFREPIGEDPTVPGFKDDPDRVMGVRVSGFHLEYAYTKAFKGPDIFYNIRLEIAVRRMRNSRNMRLLCIIVAIYRMRSYSAKYFNELLSDQSPMRVNSVLAREFKFWSVELASFESKITNFMNSPHYNYDLNYRRRHNIAYELVTGRLENSDITPEWTSSLAENAINLIYNTPVYLSPGAVRHSVVKEKLKIPVKLNVEDYWQSMLENWAEANRFYRKDCLANNYNLCKCLLRMSKSLYLMFSAMVYLRPLLVKNNRGITGERLYDFKDVLMITRDWVTKYRDRGYTKLPLPKRNDKALLSRKPSFGRTPASISSKTKQKNLPSVTVAADESWRMDDFHLPESADLINSEETGNSLDEKSLDRYFEGSEDFQIAAKQLDKDVEDLGHAYPDMVSLTEDTLECNTEDSKYTKPLVKDVEEISCAHGRIHEENKDSGVSMTSQEKSDLAKIGEGDDLTRYKTTRGVKGSKIEVEKTEGQKSLKEKKVERTTDKNARTVSQPSVIEPENENYMKRSMSPMEETLDENMKETAGSYMIKSGNEKLEHEDSSSMAKLLGRNNEDTAGSSMTNQMDMNENEGMETSMEKSQKDGENGLVEQEMTGRMGKDSDESTIREPLNEDFARNSGAPFTGRKSEDGMNSPKTEPQKQDSEENAEVPREETLVKDATPTTDSTTENTEGVKEPATEPPNNDVKQNEGAETEDDDFVEFAETPIIPTKEPRKKPSGNKSRTSPPPRLFHTYYFRRRRYSYTAISRRRRSLYTRRRRSSFTRRRRSSYTRRRRSSYTRRRRSSYTRRRRSSYTRRRRTSRKPSTKLRVTKEPNETARIKKFLRTLGCGVGRDIRRMHLYEGCMDKIQRQLRKYNRVAFSQIARYFHLRVLKALRAKLKRKLKKHRSKKRKQKRPRDGVNVKTEL